MGHRQSTGRCCTLSAPVVRVGIGLSCITVEFTTNTVFEIPLVPCLFTWKCTQRWEGSSSRCIPPRGPSDAASQMPAGQFQVQMHAASLPPRRGYIC